MLAICSYVCSLLIAAKSKEQTRRISGFFRREITGSFLVLLILLILLIAWEQIYILYHKEFYIDINCTQMNRLKQSGEKAKQNIFHLNRIFTESLCEKLENW
jgi:hypothetical protein